MPRLGVIFLAATCLAACVIAQEPKTTPDSTALLEEVRWLTGTKLRGRLGSVINSTSAVDRSQLFDDLLKALKRRSDNETEAYVREWQYRHCQAESRFADALVAAQAMREAAARSNLTLVEGDAWMAQGVSSLQMERIEDADLAVGKALEFYAKSDDLIRMGNAVSIRGGIAFERGEFETSAELHAESLRLAEDANDIPLQARASNNLGIVYKHVESLEAAIDAMQRAHDLYEELGDDRHRLAVLGNLGNVYTKLGDYEKALECQHSVLRFHKESEDAAEIAYSRTRIGLTLAAMGNYDEAVEELRCAVAMRKEHGLAGHLSRALFDLGRLLVDGGDVEEGVELLEEARDKIGESPGVLERDIFLALGDGYAKVGLFEQSTDAFKKFVELDGRLTLTDLERREATRAHASENERLRSQLAISRLKVEKHRSKVVGLTIGCILLAAFSMTLVLFGRVRRRLKLHLEEKNDQLQSTLEQLARAHTGLEDSERRYRSLFEDATNGRILIDPSDGTILQANRLAKQWIGRDDGQVDGLNIHSIAPGFVDHSDQSTFDVPSDGVILKIESATTEVEIDGGKASLITLRDVTNERLLESEQRRSQMLDSLSLLAAGIAHDFNNSLTSILGHISAARAMETPVEVGQLLQIAETAAVEAAGISDQLLVFSRGGVPVLQTRNIGTDLANWSKLFRSGSGVELVLDKPTELWPARYDKVQVTQVIFNLVINAQQAMENQGRLRISAENVTVKNWHATKLKPGQYVRITVVDSGPGIPEELRERIFSPYFSTKQDSRGLGLATSHTVLQRHNGSIRLLSTDSHGSTFEVLLPARPAAVAAESASESGDLPTLSPGHVLVIDDQPAVRAVFESMLKRLGYDVTTARNGEASLECVEEFGHFDLAVIDATIPGGWGGQVALNKLRNVDPGLRAILTSGYSKEGELESYASNGFDGVLKKPFKIEQLAEAITSALGTSSET